uniref:Uncharacterized protein n=1 Tax=Triticum urartu TaxID=4572 RepID=A0A8R7UGT8_TRIUA
MLMIGGLHSNQQHWAVSEMGERRPGNTRSGATAQEVTGSRRRLPVVSGRHQWRAGNHRDGRADRANRCHELHLNWNIVKN